MNICVFSVRKCSDGNFNDFALHLSTMTQKPPDFLPLQSLFSLQPRVKIAAGGPHVPPEYKSSSTVEFGLRSVGNYFNWFLFICSCFPLIADLFLFCCERDFMSNLHKYKQHDVIDMFNDTSRYLDDIFTIDNPEFYKHIPDMYPTELQLNKANTSDKDISFLDLTINVIGSDVHTSVYDQCDDFGFHIVIYPWMSGDVPRLPSYGVYISHLIRFARGCISVSDFHSKNLQITSKLLIQGYRNHKLRKYLEGSSGHTLAFYLNLVKFRFKNVSVGISHLVVYGDLVYKLRRVKCEANVVSSGSKIVKRLLRRMYGPVIIDRAIGLVLPFYSLVQIIP